MSGQGLEAHVNPDVIDKVILILPDKIDDRLIDSLTKIIQSNFEIFIGEHVILLNGILLGHQ